MILDCNTAWQLDILTHVKLSLDSFRIVGLKGDNLTKNCVVYGQILGLINLRTRYLYLQVLPNRSFESIKVGLQYFLNLFNISKLQIFSDAEISFKKFSDIHQKIKTDKYEKLNFANSKQAKELREAYHIRFFVHEAYRPVYTSTIERTFKSLKYSFNLFSSTVLTYSQLNLMLAIMTRSLNSKPLSAYRLKCTNHTPKDIVLISPFNLMFNGVGSQDDLLLSIPSFKKRGSDPYVLLHKTLKRNIHSLFEKFHAHFLSEHYQVSKQTPHEVSDDVNVGDLILFHLKKYDKIFANQSFLIGRIEKLFHHRNSNLIRSTLITYSDKKKLVHRTVKLIDCIPFVKGYKLGTVSDAELNDMKY